jgi:hypothetical protein
VSYCFSIDSISFLVCFTADRRAVALKLVRSKASFNDCQQWVLGKTGVEPSISTLPTWKKKLEANQHWQGEKTKKATAEKEIYAQLDDELIRMLIHIRE